MRPTVLMIDNYDSFTFNIFQYLCELGAHVVVFRNDAITLQQCIDEQPTHVVISPGPGTPSTSGICKQVIAHFAGKVPVLGVCLGHECIVELYGGKIVIADQIVHGKTSSIEHDGKGVYRMVPSEFKATRYHSLIAEEASLPNELQITSRADGLIMGVRHRRFAVEGVQYHPESVATEHGHKLLENFLEMQCR